MNDTTRKKKKNNNKLYEEREIAKGLKKCTFWIPEHAVDDTKELLGNIKELYLEQGEFHRDLIP